MDARIHPRRHERTANISSKNGLAVGGEIDDLFFDAVLKLDNCEDQHFARNDDNDGGVVDGSSAKMFPEGLTTAAMAPVTTGDDIREIGSGAPAARIADVAPFLRSAPGALGPDGGIVCLEWDGGCARDKQGRPIVACIGMPHGSANEQKAQTAYAMRRALANCLPGQPKQWTTVVEVQPRAGCAPTFRFPRSAERSVMDMQREHFSETIGGPVHFCGLPRAVTYAFKLVKPFMSAKAYSALKLKPDFSHLKDHADTSSLLKEWGGELSFDMELYLAWRAKEEDSVLTRPIRRYEGAAPKGVTLASLRGDGGDGIRIGGNNNDSSNKTASDDSVISGPSSGGSPVSYEGTLLKRGSGEGMFGTLRWKHKFVVLSSGMLWYFDMNSATDQPKDDAEASREPEPLVGAFIEHIMDDGDSCSTKSSRKRLRPHSFKVMLGGGGGRDGRRALVFAASSDAEREKWVAAFAAESMVTAKASSSFNDSDDAEAASSKGSAAAPPSA